MILSTIGFILTRLGDRGMLKPNLKIPKGLRLFRTNKLSPAASGFLST